MEDLKALVTLISKQKIKQIEIISENAFLSAHSKQLYDGVNSGQYNFDEDAILDIYGDMSKFETYRKLKYRLKQRLINTLFFIDIQKYALNPNQRAQITNAKNLAAALILHTRARRKSSIKLFELVLKSAKQYDASDVIILVLPKLIRHYGVFNYNKKKYEKYSALYKIWKRNSDADTTFNIYDVQFAQYLIHSKFVDKKDLNFLALKEDFLTSLKQFSDVDTYETKLRQFGAMYSLYTIEKNYSMLDELCLEAIFYFKSKKGFLQFPLFDFNLKHAIVHLYFKRFEKTISCLKECLSILPTEGNYNWFLINSYLLLAYLQDNRYGESLDIISRIMGHLKFRNSYELYRQQWLVKEAYFQFLIAINKVDTSKHPEHKLRKFKLSRFLNDVGEMTKDKKGMNIPVLIIEVLFLFLEKKQDRLEARLTALRQYNYRYLKQVKRSHIFIKMLCAIPEYEYNVERITKRIAKYRTQLAENPMELTEQEIQIEVIPYEDLWDMVMDLL